MEAGERPGARRRGPEREEGVGGAGAHRGGQEGPLSEFGASVVPLTLALTERWGWGEEDAKTERTQAVEERSRERRPQLQCMACGVEGGFCFRRVGTGEGV